MKFHLGKMRKMSSRKTHYLKLTVDNCRGRHHQILTHEVHILICRFTAIKVDC